MKLVKSQSREGLKAFQEARNSGQLATLRDLMNTAAFSSNLKTVRLGKAELLKKPPFINSVDGI